MTLVPTQNNVQPVNEMVSHDTRDLMLVLITWEKELHLSKKDLLRFMVSVSKYATAKVINSKVRQYKRFIA